MSDEIVHFHNVSHSMFPWEKAVFSDSDPFCKEYVFFSVLIVSHQLVTPENEKFSI